MALVIANISYFRLPVTHARCLACQVETEIDEIIGWGALGLALTNPKFWDISSPEPKLTPTKVSWPDWPPQAQQTLRVGRGALTSKN